MAQISAREEAGSSAKAVAIVACGRGVVVVVVAVVVVVVVRKQEQLGTRPRPTSHYCLGRTINLSPIAWSPDLGSYTTHPRTDKSTNSPRSLTTMVTLQPKGSIISRTSFAALDVEEPESEEELEVVELSPTE